MEKYITDERTGLQYELVADYYLVSGDDEPAERHIGIWGQCHLQYLKQHHKTVCAELLTNEKLNSYLTDLFEQVEGKLLWLSKEYAEKEGISKHSRQKIWHFEFGR